MCVYIHLSAYKLYGPIEQRGQTQVLFTSFTNVEKNNNTKDKLVLIL